MLLDVKVLQRPATDCFVRLGRVVRSRVDPRKVGAKDCRVASLVSHGAPYASFSERDGQFGLMTLICIWVTTSEVI